MSILGAALLKTSAVKSIEIMGKPISERKVDKSFTTVSRIKEAVSKKWVYEKSRQAASKVLKKPGWAPVDRVREVVTRNARKASDEPHASHRLKRSLLSVGASDALHVGTAKKAAVSDEQAQSAINRLDTLERNKPTVRQAARYGTIGAVAGPAISMIGNKVSGKPLFSGSSVHRALAGDAVKGSLAAGAIPMLRSHLDRRAEVGTLKNYLAEREKNAAFVNELSLITKSAKSEALKRFAQGAFQELGPATGALLGAGVGHVFHAPELASSGLGYGVGSMAQLLVNKKLGIKS